MSSHITPRSRDYLDDAWRVAAILGAFFVITIPLSIASRVKPGSITDAITAGYMIALGLTHFALTWTLYLPSANRRHFFSSRRNVVLYVAVPLGIMALFGALGCLDIQEFSPGVFQSRTAWVVMYAFCASVLLRSADYFHVVRQSFGVLQLLKRRAGLAPWHRRAENAFFLLMAVLQVLTFAGGLERGRSYVECLRAARFDAGQPLTAVLSSVTALLFLSISGSFAAAAISTPAGTARRAALLTTLAYFSLQSISAALVVYRSSLYRYSLAMHYVEYHLLMYPRCFHVPLDAARRGDRIMLWFRRHKSVFYVLLSGAALWIGCGFLLDIGTTPPSRGGSWSTWMLVNATNGVFLAHYFVEAMVWKFGTPYYRQSLGPLYFAPKTEANGGA